MFLLIGCSTHLFALLDVGTMGGFAHALCSDVLHVGLVPLLSLFALLLVSCLYICPVNVFCLAFLFSIGVR